MSWVDYLTERSIDIIPIEVKSGLKAGAVYSPQ
jgi:hypothetical protein